MPCPGPLDRVWRLSPIPEPTRLSEDFAVPCVLFNHRVRKERKEQWSFRSLGLSCKDNDKTRSYFDQLSTNDIISKNAHPEPVEGWQQQCKLTREIVTG